MAGVGLVLLCTWEMSWLRVGKLKVVEFCLHLIQRSQTAGLAALRYLSPSVCLSLIS